MLANACIAYIASASCARCKAVALCFANSVQKAVARFVALFAARFACSAACAPLCSQIAALFALHMRACVRYIAFLLLLYNICSTALHIASCIYCAACNMHIVHIACAYLRALACAFVCCTYANNALFANSACVRKCLFLRAMRCTALAICTSCALLYALDSSTSWHSNSLHIAKKLCAIAVAFIACILLLLLLQTQISVICCCCCCCCALRALLLLLLLHFCYVRLLLLHYALLRYVLRTICMQRAC